MNRFRLATRLLIVVAGWALATANAQSDRGVELLIEHNLAATYAQGSEHELWIRIELIDPRETLDEGVLFLNVVENDAAGRYPQAMHRVFASADEQVGENRETDSFLTPLDGDVLRAGIEARVLVKLRPRAALGSYSIVIQLFEGGETDPHRVVVDNRVAMWSHVFEVVP